MSVLVLQVQVTSNASGQIANIQAQVRGIGNAAKSTGNEVNHLSRSMKILASHFVVYQTAKFFGGLITEGLRFNALLEDTQLGIAGLVSTFNDIYVNGKKITDETQRFNASMLIAADIQEKLRVAALKTKATYESLVLAFSEAAGPAFQAGFSPDQAVKFTQLAVQAATALRIPFQQLGQEVRAIFEGDIQRYSRVSRQIIFANVDNVQAKLKELKKEGPDALFKFYEERLIAFANINERVAGTLSGSWSNFKDAYTQALGAGTQEATAVITRLLRDLTAQIVTFDKSGKATFNQEFVDGIRAVATIFVDLAHAVGFAAQAFPTLLKSMGAAWQIMKALVVDLGAVIAGMVEEAMGALGTLAQTVGNIMQENPQMARLFGGSYAQGAELIQTGIGMQTTGREYGKHKKDLQGEASDLYQKAADLMVGGGAGDQSRLDKLIEAIRLEARLGKVKEENDKAAIKAEKERLKLWDDRLDRMQKELQEEAKLLAKGVEKTASAREELEQAQLQYQLTVATSDVERARVEMKIKLARLAEEERKAMAGVEGGTADIAEQERLIRERFSIENMGAVQEYFNKVTEIHKKATEKQEEEANDAAKKSQAEGLRIAEDGYKKMLQKTQEFSKGFGDVMRRAFMDIFRGGGLSSIWDGFLDMLQGMWADALGSMFETWMQKLQEMGQGEFVEYPEAMQGYTGKKGEFVGGSKGARAGLAGAQAAAALYSIHQQSQNVPKNKSAVQGAITGAGAGAAIGGIYGAIAGAIIGGFVGWASGGLKSKFYVVSRAGRLEIIGSGEAGKSDVAQAQRAINEMARNSFEGARSVMTAFPEAIIGKLSGMDVKKLPGELSSKLGFPKMQLLSADELRKFIEVDIPKMIFDAYSPVFQVGLKELGITEAKIQAIFDETVDPGFDPKAFMERLRNFVLVFSALQEQYDFLSMTMEQKEYKAIGEIRKTPIQRLGDFNKAISTGAEGFEDLDYELQITRGQEILSLMQERYQTEIAYLEQINQISEEIAKNIKDQIFGIELDQARLGYDEQGNAIPDTKKQIDMLLGRQRGLFQELGVASTPDEVARITGEIQKLSGQLYEMMGKTPEAAKQITDQLNDANRIAQERLKIMRDAVEESDKLLRDVLKNILEFLRGVGMVVQPKPGDPGWVPPPGYVPPGKWDPELGDARIGLDYLTTAAYGAADALGVFSGSGQISIPVQQEPPMTFNPGGGMQQASPVEVHLHGSTAAIVDEVEIRSSNNVERKVINTIYRGMQRRRSL